jgi:hypothetical protein
MKRPERKLLAIIHYVIDAGVKYHLVRMNAVNTRHLAHCAVKIFPTFDDHKTIHFLDTFLQILSTAKATREA